MANISWTSAIHPHDSPMGAALLLDGSSTLHLAEVELSHLRAREVLVRTLAVGLCHSDYHAIDGTLDRPRPLLPGHEGMGVVEAVGTDVTSVAVGDHVVTCLVVGCGDCARCHLGEPNCCLQPLASRRASGDAPRLSHEGKAVGQMAHIGALSDKMLVDERALVIIPKSMPPELAALLGCSVVTGLGAVAKVARVQSGDTVAVIGCGGVGLNVVQGARIAGASRIIAIDLSDHKLQTALGLGATDAVNSSTNDIAAAVQALTNGGVDHAFEVVGREGTVL